LCGHPLLQCVAGQSQTGAKSLTIPRVFDQNPESLVVFGGCSPIEMHREAYRKSPMVSTNRNRFIPRVAAVVLLAGCTANPYSEFYEDYTRQWPAGTQARLLPSTTKPQVVFSANLRQDAQRLAEEGFFVVGFAGFRGPAVSQRDLIAQAEKVKAELVLYSSQFSHTEQGIRPVLSYRPGQTSTTYSHGYATANAYGSGGGYVYGSGIYSGSSTTTTPGTLSTDYVPYQRGMFEHGALFLNRARPGVLGASFLPLPDVLRAKLQRNTGVVVAVVMQGSPAFRANILRGDIITEIAGKPVTTVQEVMDLLPFYAGKRVSFTLIRGDRTLRIEAQLDQVH
jgi:PDZ domain